MRTDQNADVWRELRRKPEDAARKLVYLALQNATPQWTPTRNWTTALLAFKIHFGDRVPDTTN
jgi:transposase-like protein